MYDPTTVWQAAISYGDFVDQAEKNVDLWRGVYRMAKVPDWAVDALRSGSHYRLLVIAEDWCGDATNTVPVIAKWVDAVPGLELRVVKRDDHPEIMDQHLTNGARSIPMVVVLDDAGQLMGTWGPRPAELQEWVMANKDVIPSKERYPQVRRWYARNRGMATLEELIRVINSSRPSLREPEPHPVLQPS